MTAIAQFPLPGRRAIRGAINPLDKCTVISIFPRAIQEVKPTLQPSVYEMEAGSYQDPAILIVGTAAYWQEIDEQQPLLEIPVMSPLVAASVCNDFMNGMVECNMNDAKPGLFFVPGEYTLKSVREKYQSLIDKAKEKQDNWYSKLVKTADSLWSRTNGNPLAIDELMRLAARELREDREWVNKLSVISTLVPCVACGTPRNDKYPVCPNCKHIDQELAKKLGITFAEVK